MATKRTSTTAVERTEKQRLAAEIANEPQWVVWPDAEREDAWAAGETAVDWGAAARQTTRSD